VINNPQILVVYEPGMYGTFLCSLFMMQKLWGGADLDQEFPPSPMSSVNAHHSGYRDKLSNFHTNHHIEILLEKNHDELKKFFLPLQAIKLGVHRLASYNFLKLDYKKYFNNFTILLIKPKTHRLGAYIQRMEESTTNDYETQWWYKNFRKKDLGKMPKWFLEKLSMKEKQKYMEKHVNMVNNYLDNDQQNIIVFDPDQIAGPNLLQEMADKVCGSLGIDNFKIPSDKVKKFVDRNSKYFSTD